MSLPKRILEEKIRKFLEEDIGQGDITTALTVPPETIIEAEIIAKEAGVIAGIDETRTMLESLNLQAETHVTDGSKIEEKTTVMKITGDARTLLSIERTLLNLLSRMSGIATATSRLVNKVQTKEDALRRQLSLVLGQSRARQGDVWVRGRGADHPEDV